MAEELMRHELLTEAFVALESQYIDAWRTTAVHDERGRERLFLAVNQVAKVRDHLLKIMANGRIAQRDIDQLTGKLGRPRAA